MIIIGDMHYSTPNLGVLENHVEPEIMKVVYERCPQAVVFLGDLFHYHAKNHLSAFCQLTNFIEAIASYAPDVYILVGNHDIANNQEYLTRKHWLTHLHWLDNVHVIEKPTKAVIDDKNVLLTPYVPNERFEEAMSGVVRWQECDLVLGHQEIMGCNMGSTVSKHGVTWSPEWPRLVTGHIHVHQQLMGGHVMMLGTPYHTSFNDGEGSKYILDMSDGKEELIELKVPKRVELTSTVAGLDEIRSQFNDFDKIRLKVRDSFENIEKFKKTKDFKDLNKRFKVNCIRTDKVVKRVHATGSKFSDIFDSIVKAKKSDGLESLISELMSG